MVQSVPSRKSRQDYDAIGDTFAPVENMDLPVLGLTSAGKIVYMNPSACRLLGYPKDELTGRSFGTIAPEMTAAAWSSFWARLEQESLAPGRVTLRQSDKNELAVKFAALFIQGSNRKFCGVLIAAPEKYSTTPVDQSAQEQPLGQVLNAMTCPILILDAQHKVTFLNQAACQAFGTTVAQASGKTVHNFLPKKYADIVWEREQDVLDKGRPSTHEGDGFLRAKFGESFTMLPFFDSRTSQKGILGVINIGAIPRSKETLAARAAEPLPGPPSSAHLAALPRLVERGSVGMFLKDINNRYLWVNHTFAQMNGMAPSQLIGMPVEDLVADPEIMANLCKEDDYIYATGQPLFNRMIPRFNSPSGYYRVDKIPFIDRTGGIVGIIGLVVEVDEPRPPLEELKKALLLKSQKLRDTETALRVLIERREQDSSLTKEELKAKVKDLVVPYLEFLKQTKLKPEQAEFVELMETNLKNFYDPAHARLASSAYQLSPTELKVAKLIREGKTNKEIAALLHLSKSTILTHRHHVRAKLGIKNKKVNLRSLLNS